MDTKKRENLGEYLKLFKLHRGERSRAYDDVAALYDGFVQVWDRHIAAGALTYFNQLIAKYTKPGAIVLDAGAGTGERTLALLQNSQPGRIVALDASKKMLDIARSKIEDPRVEFEVGDLARLPFPDNTFDIVTCTWAIEIMDDPRAAVQEFIRVIKADGIVIYAFCSLPDGPTGKVLKYVLNKTAHGSPLNQLLSDNERPFHHCERSSLKKFAGGLTTVAVVAKCCNVTDEVLPCKDTTLVLDEALQGKPAPVFMNGR